VTKEPRWGARIAEAVEKRVQVQKDGWRGEYPERVGVPSLARKGGSFSNLPHGKMRRASGTGGRKEKRGNTPRKKTHSHKEGERKKRGISAQKRRRRGTQRLDGAHRGGDVKRSPTVGQRDGKG